MYKETIPSYYTLSETHKLLIMREGWVGVGFAPSIPRALV